MPDDEPAASLILAITPEPTPDERDAIIAALVALRSRRVVLAAPEGTVMPMRWQRTARREAVRAGDVDRGWY